MIARRADSLDRAAAPPKQAIKEAAKVAAARGASPFAGRRTPARSSSREAHSQNGSTTTGTVPIPGE